MRNAKVKVQSIVRRGIRRRVRALPGALVLLAATGGVASAQASRSADGSAGPR